MSVGTKKAAPEPSGLEQAVARALRDNLGKLQRTADELHQAVADTVAACASSRSTNALPPMLRAQTAAASLSASLEVLTRFVASSLQSAPRMPLEDDILRLARAEHAAVADEVEPAAAAQFPISDEDQQAGHAPQTASPPAFAATPPVAAHASVPEPTRRRFEQPIPAAPPSREEVYQQPPPAAERVPVAAEASVEEATESLIYSEPAVEEAAQFDVARLPQAEQELHRRANRVAKVSMQDIKMLRPEQVKAGLEHKDLCKRLRDDIAKAHKEYDRRFRPIMDHPVDYFYHWMVEILAEGDPRALGEYPYPLPVRNR